MPPQAQADVVPPNPHHHHNPLPSLSELQSRMDNVEGRMERLEQLARQHVNSSGARKLTTKEKLVAGATAAGLVATGVVTTLVVQRIRRGKSNPAPGSPPAPMVGITTGTFGT